MSRTAHVITLAILPALCFAGPLTREEAERQQRVFEELKESVAAETTDVARFAVITQVMSRERNVDLRGRIIEFAAKHPGPALEAFLTSVLTSDTDAGLRSQAATELGRTGSEKCLSVLAKAAASDPTTSVQIGDIGGTSSARRAATFAIAELALRFPDLADTATAKLRALPDADDPADTESLSDARRQALYQLTRDKTLLQPFFDRLKSRDAKERARGVVAFRFLKLKKAPPELVQALEDDDLDVRLWGALVLGEIGDPDGADPLMKLAADASLDRGVRVNAITALGRMRARAAADLMEKLLTDPEVSANAAIALYRITGRKVAQFPEGYNAN